MAGAARRPGVAPLRGAVFVTGKAGAAATGWQPRPAGTAGFRHREDGGLGETGPPASAAVSGSRHRFGAEPKVKGAKNLEHRVQRGTAIARQRVVETFP